MTKLDDYQPASRSSGFQKPKSGLSIYIVVFLLAAGFLILVALVIGFSSSSGQSFLIGGGQCIAVVNIDQEITVADSAPSLFSGGQSGSERIADAIYSLNKRDDVAGVLFVINSPGGSVVATREIYKSVKELKKPKVAYFREVAASGGYYISTPMDYIISDPDAITGSIGVIATFTDMSSLFEKVGINATAIKSGVHKDIGSPAREMTDEERNILQVIVNETFDEFKSVVIEGRKGKLNLEKFGQITDGRILSGRQAKEVGLVDALGDKRDAVKKTAELAGLPNAGEPRTCEVTIREQEKGLFGLESVFRGLFSKPEGKVSLRLE